MQRILSSRFSSLLRKQKCGFAEMDKFKQSFLSTTNLPYIEALYESWLKDKDSVSPSFPAYFKLIEKGRDPYEAFEHPSAVHAAPVAAATGTDAVKEVTKQLKMRLMIEGYRSFGHQFAKIDPLYLPQNKNLHGKLHEDSIKATSFGFNPNDMNETITVQNMRGEGRDNGPYTIQQRSRDPRQRQRRVPNVLDKCVKIAIAFRQKFSKDFFTDIIRFRPYGHNEQDQPNFTQPHVRQDQESPSQLQNLLGKTGDSPDLVKVERVV
jgi:2-oxoglutarate dehydrogenase complex dehydrogenase (E1) component-like enzyme